MVEKQQRDQHGRRRAVREDREVMSRDVDQTVLQTCVWQEMRSHQKPRSDMSQLDLWRGLRHPVDMLLEVSRRKLGMRWNSGEKSWLGLGAFRVQQCLVSWG